MKKSKNGVSGISDIFYGFSSNEERIPDRKPFYYSALDQIHGGLTI